MSYVQRENNVILARICTHIYERFWMKRGNKKLTHYSRVYIVVTIRTK